jgi:hypothetical protein
MAAFTTTTDVYLDVDGVPLATLGYNVITWGGDRETPPPLRGANLQVPGMPGQSFTNKVEDARSITLSMWVQGSNIDGTVPTTQTARATFENNWKTLRKLFYTPRRQIALTKRFRPYGSSTVIAATAKAQYAGGLSPTMQGELEAVFSVQLTLTDPYFYTPPTVLPALTAAAPTQTFTSVGDGRTNKIFVAFDGQLAANVRVTNTPADDTADPMWVQYTNALAAGDVANLDVKKFKSTTTPHGGVLFGSRGYVQHGGDKFWLAVDPGVNTLALSGTGSGSVQVSYQEAYI